jgi:hypothetical protein
MNLYNCHTDYIFYVHSRACKTLQLLLMFFFYSATEKTKSSNCFMNFINRHWNRTKGQTSMIRMESNCLYYSNCFTKLFIIYKSVIVLTELSLNVCCTLINDHQCINRNASVITCDQRIFDIVLLHLYISKI